MNYLQTFAAISKTEQDIANFEAQRRKERSELVRRNNQTLERTRNFVRNRATRSHQVRALHSLENEERYQPAGEVLPERSDEWAPAFEAQFGAVAAAGRAYEQLEVRNNREKCKAEELQTIGIAAGFGAAYAFLVWVFDPNILEAAVLLLAACFAGGIITRVRRSTLLDQLVLKGEPRRSSTVGALITLGAGLFMASWGAPAGRIGYEADVLETLTRQVVSAGGLPGLLLLIYLGVKAFQARKNIGLNEAALRQELQGGRRT